MFASFARGVAPLIGASVAFRHVTPNACVASCSTITESHAKLGICQIRVESDKGANIERARSAISEAKRKGAQIAVLPEIWNGPYNTKSFPVYAEILPKVGEKPDPKLSPSATMLCEEAKKQNVWLVGGSISEKEVNSADGTEKIFNTSLVVDNRGNVVGKHRKVHLFDIDIPGKITFKESDSLTPGSEVTVFDSPWGKIGVGICYDLRFPELATVMRQKGCKLLIYPGAFNMTTGPLHWQLLQRARAVDNQVYVVTCSPARHKSAGYVAYGHSHVIAPMGEVIGDAGEGDNVIVVDIDMNQVESMRQGIPCWSQKRFDLYDTIAK